MRTSECSRFEAANSEFAISLLDCRHLAGDHGLFARLHDEVIPKLLARESEQIVKDLAELTRAPHGNSAARCFTWNPTLKTVRAGCAITTWSVGFRCSQLSNISCVAE